ncbi:MAG TPA: TonB-dependent receptor [Gemmatimonadales bacterium]|nr:TonB-dependent receptor [Gemmatimonadales bacterium]
MTLSSLTRASALAALWFVAPLASLSAQPGIIRGKVTDAGGALIAGAIVSADRTVLQVVTGGSGRYELRGVPAGTRTLRVRAVGHLPASATVTLEAGGTVEHDFTLERTPVQLAPVDVVVGSRARHTAAQELAVPVDIIPSTVLTEQGTTETSQILQAVSPSVNFPRQSVADADDIVRPFTFRGLSPDHTLVLVNGQRRHRTALVHIFAAGMAAGSTGVDLNALPSGAIDRIEILRDGASAQYGSDAIAGVVNFVLKQGPFSPYLTTDVGRYVTRDYPDDGTAVTVNGGWGFGLGRGSLALFAEYRHRDATNRAWPEEADQIVPGDADDIDDDGNIISKNNPVPQPNHHWGDGLAKDLITFGNLRFPLNASGSSELYASGGWSHRVGTGNGFRRQGISERNWPEIYPLGYLPEFRPDVWDWSVATGVRGAVAGWGLDLGGSFGRNIFRYNLNNTMNVSLGPCLTTACAPGLDGIFGNGDDPGIPNQTSFHAGTLAANELDLTLNAARPLELGLSRAANLAFGISYRREYYDITAGEPASYINGGHLDRNGDIAPPGSQVFGGFRPANAVDVSRGNFGANAELEAGLSEQVLVNAALRFEDYSDAGDRLTGKAALRFQPSEAVVLRAAASTGFRAPSLAQSYYNSTQTTFILDPNTGKQTPLDFGIFSTNSEPAQLLGATPLKNERSVNLSGGFVWSPGERFSLTADGYFVRIADRIVMTDFLAGPEVEAILAGAGFPSITGAIYFTNALTTRTLGFDLVGNYLAPVGKAGSFGLNVAFNVGSNKITDEKPVPSQLSGIVTSRFGILSRLALERERPRWRNTVTANYTQGAYHGLLRSSWYGKFTSAQLGACETCGQTYGSRLLIDAEVGRRFAELNVSLGARNLFDSYPDRASLDNGFGIFPWPMASPFGYNGRYLYLRAEMAFRR